MATLNHQQHHQIELHHTPHQQSLQRINHQLSRTFRMHSAVNKAPIPFDPVALLQACTSNFATLAQHNNTLLFCIPDLDTPRSVIGNPDYIRQILNNFISNALAFTPAGHIIVWLRQQPAGDNQVRLLFQVTDSGIGIPQHLQHQLWIPNASNTHATPDHHHNWGLPLCAQLAEQMDTSIQLTSEPGLGSSFSFSLLLPVPPSIEIRDIRPSLYGLKLHVRSPHVELSKSICGWLNKWGANTDIVLPDAPIHGQHHEILLDILMPASCPPANWSGHYLSVSSRDGSATLNADYLNPENLGLALERWHHQHTANSHPDDTAMRAVLAQSSKPGLHVLIIEQNPVTLAALHQQLALMNCLVTVAHNSHEAIDVWDETSHDIILVSASPQNIETLSLQLQQHTIQAPIIGFSSMAATEQYCQHVGINTFLRLPAKLRTLHDLLYSFPGTSIPKRYKCIFRQTMSADLVLLTQSLQAQHYEAAQTIMHRMAGALAVMGLQDMADAMLQQEENLRRDIYTDHVAPDALMALCMTLQKLINQAE